MSEQYGQIFAYFPGQRGTKLLVDVTKIEAIEQSAKPEYATIHTAARQYYVYVEDPMGNEQVDAMEYITTQIALVSEAAEHAEREAAATEPKSILVPESEFDNEDDFDLEDFVEVPRPE